MRDKRVIWHFGPGQADGGRSDKDLLGGKGAGLAEMCRIGLPVPPGFTILTTVCQRFEEAGERLPEDVREAVKAAIVRLEQETGKAFGDPQRPLLVSVRSGAAVSMPGMMDTVLNLGLTSETMEALAERTQNRRFALDARRRFIQMFANVVDGLPLMPFERILDRAQDKLGVYSEAELDAEALEGVVAEFLELYRQKTGAAFSEDPLAQLERAIEAVFRSWNGDRAVQYRTISDIADLKGTAVNVQAMVFGNLGPTSGTGVCFTRDPSTGENLLYGEYLMNAQGEDVVAGIRTPNDIATLCDASPKAATQLDEVRTTLERHYRDVQDIEFTIEEESLYILQTRAGKRTAKASVRAAVEMAEEGLITREEAVQRVTPTDLDRLLHPQFDPEAERNVIARGLPASPGAVSGRIAFTSEEAQERAAAGDSVILVRNETSPEDIGGMHAAAGVLTATGGMTSHAAVVARGMGKCCVAGTRDIRIDHTGSYFRVGDLQLSRGDVISLDGSTGEVMTGEVRTMPSKPGPELGTLLGWADEIRRMGVRANADTPPDAEAARNFGAQGIGLCRTEHMFFGEDRITAMREVILAESESSRRTGLQKLLPVQRADFHGILAAMDALPVTIRLLDPPLHEFLPHEDAAVTAVATELGKTEAQVRERAHRLTEMNPMLGHRGCRLGVSYPEIYEVQVQAIFEAAAALKGEGKQPCPEVMIPLVGTVTEYTTLRDRLVTVAQRVLESEGVDLPIVFGTMIEVPRACLTADAIAAEADFFSFGTNDLTQMTYGYSRDDIGSFLPKYLEDGLLAHDPFQVLDQDAVGQLVRMAAERGRAAKPGLKIGICGEHGGEPTSIAFCDGVGLDYVSCSPFRVPIARLAAAQATLAANQ